MEAVDSGALADLDSILATATGAHGFFFGSPVAFEGRDEAWDLEELEAEAEASWFEVNDRVSGRPYYANAVTLETTWEPPSSYRPLLHCPGEALEVIEEKGGGVGRAGGADYEEEDERDPLGSCREGERLVDAMSGHRMETEHQPAVLTQLHTRLSASQSRGQRGPGDYVHNAGTIPPSQSREPKGPEPPGLRL